MSANLMLREIGIVLFLASVGIEAGANFVHTVVEGDGLLYVGYGFLITVIPLLIIGAIARLYYKVNYFTLMGLIAGSNTDPPALAYSTQASNNDAPAVGYSTVYKSVHFETVQDVRSYYFYEKRVKFILSICQIDIPTPCRIRSIHTL